MLKFGKEPYLECSSRGDKRFSAFYTRIEGPTGLVKSIEDWYQGSKKFEDGSMGLNWRQAKGRIPINPEECREYYSELWNIYFEKHPELLDVIKKYNGFTDIYGQEGHACQAEEVYRIRMALESPTEARGEFNRGESYPTTTQLLKRTSEAVMAFKQHTEDLDCQRGCEHIYVASMKEIND